MYTILARKEANVYITQTFYQVMLVLKIDDSYVTKKPGRLSSHCHCRGCL